MLGSGVEAGGQLSGADWGAQQAAPGQGLTDFITGSGYRALLGSTCTAAVSCCACALISLVTAHILLCLIYKLNFLTDMHVEFSTN